MNRKKCFIVCGPTAVGKTDYAIDLALKHSTSIISADSRQCYHELNIGVAKPSPQQLQIVPHYFINTHSIQEEVNVKVFETEALDAADSIFKENDTVVMVGGTGLYIKAFSEGLDDIPEADEGIRNEINQNFGSADDAYVDEIEQKFKTRALQTSGFDFSDLFDINSEIGEEIIEKTHMADKKIQSAMEKMERKFSFKEEFGNIPRPTRPQRPPVDAQPGVMKSAPISREEKIMILKMLQDGKISAEEADRLLRALEQF